MLPLLALLGAPAALAADPPEPPDEPLPAEETVEEPTSPADPVAVNGSTVRPAPGLQLASGIGLTMGGIGAAALGLGTVIIGTSPEPVGGFVLAVPGAAALVLGGTAAAISTFAQAKHVDASKQWTLIGTGLLASGLVIGVAGPLTATEAGSWVGLIGGPLLGVAGLGFFAAQGVRNLAMASSGPASHRERRRLGLDATNPTLRALSATGATVFGLGAFGLAFSAMTIEGRDPPPDLLRPEPVSIYIMTAGLALTGGSTWGQASHVGVPAGLAQAGLIAGVAGIGLGATVRIDGVPPGVVIPVGLVGLATGVSLIAAQGIRNRGSKTRARRAMGPPVRLTPTVSRQGTGIALSGCW